MPARLDVTADEVAVVHSEQTAAIISRANGDLLSCTRRDGASWLAQDGTPPSGWLRLDGIDPDDAREAVLDAGWRWRDEGGTVRLGTPSGDAAAPPPEGTTVVLRTEEERLRARRHSRLVASTWLFVALLGLWLWLPPRFTVWASILFGVVVFVAVMSVDAVRVGPARPDLTAHITPHRLTITDGTRIRAVLRAPVASVHPTSRGLHFRTSDGTAIYWLHTPHPDTLATALIAHGWPPPRGKVAA